jgi:hypothetical protein
MSNTALHSASQTQLLNAPAAAHISSYSKRSLFFPDVEFSKLNPDQAEIIRGYMRDIKQLDRELGKKIKIKATKMIHIKPYNDDD